MTACSCRCHAYGAGTHVSCDVDNGGSGIPGVAYCGPHTSQAPASDAHCVVCPVPETEAFLCRSCGEYLTQLLAELPARLTDLEITATRQARVGNLPGHERDEHLDRVLAEYFEVRYVPARLRSPMGRMTLPSTPLPYHPAASQLWNLAVNAIGTWARHLCEARGLEYLGGPKPEDVCTWLVNNVEAIRQDEAAGEIHSAVVRLTDAILHAVDRHDPDRFVGVCSSVILSLNHADGVLTPDADECGTDLFVREGEETVTCLRCDSTYELAERRERMLERAPDQIASTLAIANALTTDEAPVTPSMIRQMAFRGQIVQRGVEPGTRSSLYRVGDVIDVLTARAEKPQKPSTRRKTAEATA